MRILIVSYYPLPAMGGIWRFVSQLKERLEHFGHEVDVLSHNPEATKYRIINRHPEIEISQISPVIRQKIDKEFPNLHKNYWIYHTEIYRYSLELSSLYYGLDQYEIIHAQDVLAAQAMNRVKPKEIPLVMSAHGYLSGAIFFHLKTMYPHKTDDQIKNSFEYKYHNTIEYEGYHSSDFIHTQSKWMRNNIIDKFSVHNKKIFTFPYGMDIERFLKKAKGESSVSPLQNKKVILFTGRLVYLKGIQYLIDALAMLKADRDDWECWILGEGVLKNELQVQCHKLGVTNEVKFLGVSDNVPYFLQKADIFVLPGLQDTQPHSVMEAQLLGVPTIVSDASGLPEMVLNKENGLIVPAGNSNELYKALKYLLENDEVRREFSNRAQTWAQDRWKMDKMVNNFIKMYKNIINK